MNTHIKRINAPYPHRSIKSKQNPKNYNFHNFNLYFAAGTGFEPVNMSEFQISHNVCQFQSTNYSGVPLMPFLIRGDFLFGLYILFRELPYKGKTGFNWP